MSEPSVSHSPDLAGDTAKTSETVQRRGILLNTKLLVTFLKNKGMGPLLINIH